MKEIQSLEGKKAIRRLNPAEVAYYQREHGDKVEVVPGKAIHAVKAPDGRRKCRLVVCGNYLKGAGRGPGDRSEAAQLYAGGADTTCLRTSLALAATRGWQAASLDIKTAFLNAPLRTLQESSRKKAIALEDAHGRPQEDHEEAGGGHGGQEEMTVEEQQEEDLTKRKRLVLMLPPKILVRLGLVKEGEMWLVEKALYGLCESPKLWGDYRDIEISQMSFQANFITYEYQQSFAEENLWLVRRKDAGDGDQVEGFALVYVDDVMLFGTREIVEGGLQSFRRTWETSEPTWVGDREPVRYCGMELSRTEQGDFFANQCSYLREIVRRYGMEDLCSAQMMKDSQEPEDELDRTPLQVREAQQLGGELLWLATKTRPDIAYTVSRICSATSRAPKWAVQTA